MIALMENSYGKSSVRVMKVRRDRPLHSVWEWKVEVLLSGDFTTCFTEGDNSAILPTDTMKNTVYSRARESKAECIEDFALELCEFFLSRNPQVEKVAIHVASTSWEHALVQGKPHPTTFTRGSSEAQTTAVTCAQRGNASVTSGLENLLILKTANSGFEGYLRDSLTTLPETADRLLGTSMRAQWKYKSASLPFDPLRTKLRDTLIQSFAEHDSKSVQHTLYAMGEAVLSSFDRIREIHLSLPNKHFNLVDLSPFGMDNPAEVFLPSEEPHGVIEATLRKE